MKKITLFLHLLYPCLHGGPAKQEDALDRYEKRNRNKNDKIIYSIFGKNKNPNPDDDDMRFIDAQADALNLTSKEIWIEKN